MTLSASGYRNKDKNDAHFSFLAKNLPVENTFFPSLRHLEFSTECSLPAVRLFGEKVLSPSIETLLLRIYHMKDADVKNALDFLDKVAAVSPDIKEVSVVREDGEHDWNQDRMSQLLSTLGQLHNLTGIELPCGLVTPSVVSRLHVLPSVKWIQRSGSELAYDANINVIESSNPGNDNIFPLLEQLDLEGTIVHVISWLYNGPVKLISLTALSVRDNFFLSVPALEAFLRMIRVSCRNIKTLEVTRDIGELLTSNLIEERLRETAPIPLSTLSPLADLPHLQSFYFSYTQPVIAEDDELALLLSRCTKMVRFVLEFDPFHREFQTPLTLAVLNDIARLCPRMRQLGIAVNCQSRKFLEISDMVPYQRLRILHLGVTPLSSGHINDIARYLVDLIPETCSFRVTDTLAYFNSSNGTTEMGIGIWDRLMSHFGDRWRSWDKIVHSVLLIREIREEERLKHEDEIAFLKSGLKKYRKALSSAGEFNMLHALISVELKHCSANLSAGAKYPFIIDFWGQGYLSLKMVSACSRIF